MNLRNTVLMLAASAALTFAQGPGHGGMRGGGDPQQGLQRRIGMLTQRLTLTDAQRTAATKIFADAMTASENLRTQGQTARQGLDEAIKANNVSAIDSFAAQSGNLNGQLTAIHAKAEAAFYALLTAEQKAKYNERSERGPRGGMAGPMGARPGFGR